ALFLSNRRKIEARTEQLNEEWSKLRIQSIPLSTPSGSLTSKKALFLSNRRKIEARTEQLNEEWSKLRIQSIPLSTPSGSLTSKK
ncbi:histone-lysine N-methyltransferase EZH1 isoform X1, partial [Tachysurus ichikawai]